MSRAQRREITSFVLAVVVHFYTFSVCHSVNLGHREHDFTASQPPGSTAAERESTHQEQVAQQGNMRDAGRVERRPKLPALDELRRLSAAFRGETPPRATVPTLVEVDGNFTLHGVFWTAGNISKHPLLSTPDFEDGYQADFTGFEGVRGKVLGPSYDSTHFSQWLAMRPFVQCDDHVMTFTASGLGFTQLFVDREGASPISLFQLPSSCGYTVKTSWSDFEMMAPYDACYITKENGSYVLPMLWWGSPLKLSCPVRVVTPSPSQPPSVFCSSYGMAVQIHGQEQDVGMLGVKVNGGWRPFVSEECAYRVHSSPEQLNFFISYTAPCITGGDGLQIQLIYTSHQYILSCPIHLYIPRTPLSPSDPQFPYIPDPVDPVPTSPPPPLPQPPTQEQITQLPGYPYYPYPGLQYPQIPQVYPPGPQPSRPPQPTPGSPPGHQPEQVRQESLYPTGLGIQTYPPVDHTEYPYPPYVVVQTPPSSDLSQVQDNSLHQVSKLDVISSQHLSSLNYPYIPLHYPAVTPAPTSEAKRTTTTATQPPKHPDSVYYPQYYPQMLYYPAFTETPVIQKPLSVPPQAPEQRVDPQYPVNPFYSPTSFDPYHYYYYGDFSYPKPGPVVSPASTSHPPFTPPSPPTTDPTKQAGSPSHPFGHFYPQRPVYLTLPTPLPPAKDKQPIPQESQKPVFPQVTCPPNSQTFCGYYPHPYYPYYHPLHPPHFHPPHLPVPQHPQTQLPVTVKKPHTTTTTTTSPPTTLTRPTPQRARLQCLNGRMVVFLPFAHPESIQVRDHMKKWLFLSSVSPLCGYVVQMAEDSGVILHSPLPACHSEPRTPVAITLPLRFWDLSMAHYRTLELQCPYQTSPSVSPSVSPSPSTTRQGKVIPRGVSKPDVFCSSNQMAVELPAGPISGIVLKDIKGNQMNFQDAPKHCGYSAKKGKDGKINLTLQLHSNCHMSVQGKMYIITIVYMTVNGKREAQLFCPHLVPGSGQECNLSSKQRLPCGPDSVSQPQCLSMGCCFSKQPPACYYPMDECTIDRHFVFSVPATLTEPPLSPALLVTAGNPPCKPQRVTSDYALFKIPMNGCGTRRVMMGKTVIYMVEVINQVQAVRLGYGTITRDSPIRLLVECRYLPSTVLSVSYMVKTPSLGPAIQTHGVFGVQLRIAKDPQYSSYYPQYHQPLEMLLGKPLYLEVRLLNAPDPNLVLLVHYCVAYPRSGKAVWLLLYNGCPNPLDPAPQQAVVVNPPPPAPQAQTRRFTISTFQFLPDGEFKDPEEEIYFMCSTEICSPRDGPCVEGCFGQ